ncbi:MAG: hypothetical protein GY943_18535 [Chloroflexi bacterium]|nr:hypothetical protein [Chloroflexota bacterium]
MLSDTFMCALMAEPLVLRSGAGIDPKANARNATETVTNHVQTIFGGESSVHSDFFDEAQ